MAFHSPAASTGPSERSDGRPSRLGLRLGASLRRALEVEAVGVVEDAVADGVGEVRVADAGLPVLGWELAGDEGP